MNKIIVLLALVALSAAGRHPSSKSYYDSPKVHDGPSYQSKSNPTHSYSDPEQYPQRRPHFNLAHSDGEYAPVEYYAPPNQYATQDYYNNYYPEENYASTEYPTEEYQAEEYQQDAQEYTTVDHSYAPTEYHYDPNVPTTYRGPDYDAYNHPNYGYPTERFSSKTFTKSKSLHDNGSAFAKSGKNEYANQEVESEQGSKAKGFNDKSYVEGGDFQEYGAAEAQHVAETKDLGNSQSKSQEIDYGKSKSSGVSNKQVGSTKGDQKYVATEQNEVAKSIDNGSQFQKSHVAKFGQDSKEKTLQSNEYGSNSNTAKQAKDSSSQATLDYDKNFAKKNSEFSSEKKKVVDNGKSSDSHETYDDFKHEKDNGYGNTVSAFGKKSTKSQKSVDLGGKVQGESTNKFANAESVFSKVNQQFANSDKFYTEQKESSDYAADTKLSSKNKNENGSSIGTEWGKDNGNQAQVASQKSEKYTQN